MITLVDIEKGIKYEQKLLHELIEQIQKAGDEAAEAEATYKAKFSQARLVARSLRDKITVGEVDDIAGEQCQAEHLNYLITENRFATLKEGLRASQARLNGWQTLAASMRLNGA